MSNENSVYCHDCQKILKNWIEFQLVDEQGKPLAGITVPVIGILRWRN